MIVLVGVIGLALIALVMGLTYALKNTRAIQDQSLAENYAKEAAEWILFEKESDWTNVASHLGTYCLNDLTGTWPAAGACAEGNYITGTVYWREVVVTELVAGSKLGVEVAVRWLSSNKPTFSSPEEVKIQFELSKWR